MLSLAFYFGLLLGVLIVLYFLNLLTRLSIMGRLAIHLFYTFYSAPASWPGEAGTGEFSHNQVVLFSFLL